MICANPDIVDSSITNVLETYPRDELFQSTTEELTRTCMGILSLQERPRARLFLRRDRQRQARAHDHGVNAFFQRGSVGAAFRLVPGHIRTLEELGLAGELTRRALDGLGETFTLDELRAGGTTRLVPRRSSVSTSSVTVAAEPLRGSTPVAFWVHPLSKQPGCSCVENLPRV